MQEKSPSRISHKFGEYYGQGLVNGINDTSNKAEKSGTNLGMSAIKGLKSAISKVSEIMSDNMDTNPVIAPVVDLRNVKSGSRQLNGMLTDMTNKSIGFRSSVSLANSVSSGMRPSVQVQDSVKDLVKALRDNDSFSTKNTYNINGITYDDGSNVAEAIRTIIRAARVERRS